MAVVLSNRKLKSCEIAEELKILESSLFTILHEHLSMRKLCSKWVPCLLTVDQKHHVGDSEHCLQLFQCNKKEFLHKYVTMDETWIHYFTLESNWQSAGWRTADESRPKQTKMRTSADKVLASIFWNAQGILFLDYLEKGRTINSEYHIALLMHLMEETTKKLPQIKKKKCSFTKTMQCVTRRSQRWQNYMNCTSNCFHTRTIFQITAYLQNSKEWSRERDLAPMKK